MFSTSLLWDGFREIHRHGLGFVAREQARLPGRVVVIPEVDPSPGRFVSSTRNALAITAMYQRGGKRVRMSITSPLMQLSPNGWGSAWGKIDSNIRATNLIGDVITKMKRNHDTRPI